MPAKLPEWAAQPPTPPPRGKQVELPARAQTSSVSRLVHREASVLGYGLMLGQPEPRPESQAQGSLPPARVLYDVAAYSTPCVEGVWEGGSDAPPHPPQPSWEQGMEWRQDLLPWGQKGSSWESMRRMWAERLGTEARRGLTGDGLSVPPNPGLGGAHKRVTANSAPYPPWAPLLAHPELGPPACQVHLPWKERRRRGVLGAAPPSPATQSRARPGIMAAASARPIPAAQGAQGAQGSAGACGGASSRPGLCPGIWRRRSCSKGRGREAGGGRVPRDQITALRERGWGVAFHFRALLSLAGCPVWPQSQTHPRWAHPRGQPHTGRRPPHHVTLARNPPSCIHTHRH